jgi:hypothetical protein
VADKPSEHGVNYQWYTLYISLGVITDSKLELVFFFFAQKSGSMMHSDYWSVSHERCC